jgi:uncharacterized protein YkwD
MKQFIFKGLLTIILLSSVSSYSRQPAVTNQFKQEFLSRINELRQKGCNCGVTYMPPAPPLIWNEQLEKAALGHAKDMNRRNYFSHTSKDGRSISDRIVGAGYDYKGFKSYSIGENIAFGQQSIEEVMNGWIKSEGHCKNLMNPDFKEIGVAQYNTYWVQDFGGRQAFSDEQQKLIKSGQYRVIERGNSMH